MSSDSDDAANGNFHHDMVAMEKLTQARAKLALDRRQERQNARLMHAAQKDLNKAKRLAKKQARAARKGKTGKVAPADGGGASGVGVSVGAGASAGAGASSDATAAAGGDSGAVVDQVLGMPPPGLPAPSAMNKSEEQMALMMAAHEASMATELAQHNAQMWIAGESRRVEVRKHDAAQFLDELHPRYGETAYVLNIAYGTAECKMDVGGELIFVACMIPETKTSAARPSLVRIPRMPVQQVMQDVARLHPTKQSRVYRDLNLWAKEETKRLHRWRAARHLQRMYRGMRGRERAERMRRDLAGDLLFFSRRSYN